MILVTVGTEQYPFNALMDWVDLLIKEGIINEEVTIQYGSSTTLPDDVKVGSVSHLLNPVIDKNRKPIPAFFIINDCYFLPNKCETLPDCCNAREEVSIFPRKN